MADFRIGWVVVFQKDGLDLEGMKHYFINKGTKVVDTKEDTLTVCNERTGLEEDRDCVIFFLDSEGIVIPFDIRSELNLRRVEDYIYMPIAR